MFRRTIDLTEAEEAEFTATNFDSLQDFIRTLQEEQERNGSMMYMRRLEPFLISMKEYVEVVNATDVFVDISDVISYLWVSDSAYFPGNVDKQIGSQIFVGSDETYHHGKEGDSIFQGLSVLRDYLSSSPSHFLKHSILSWTHINRSESRYLPV